MADAGRVRFIILFEGRTGSSFVVSCLGSHPAVSAHDEILDRFVGFRSALDERNRDGARERQIAPTLQVYPLVDGAGARQIELLHRTYADVTEAAIRAVGFKTKLSSVLDRNAFSQALRIDGVKVVHLQRRNVVKQVVSSLNSGRIFKATGHWNLLDEKDRLPAFAVAPDLFEEKLRHRIESEARLAGFVQALRQRGPVGSPALPVLELHYESILTEPDRFFARLLAFLEVPQRPLVARTLKNTDDDLRRALSNFDELRGHFAGTPYEAMFDEVAAVPAER